MIKFLILAIIAMVAVLIWSFGIEPKLLDVVRYKIKQPELKGLKIVFASDFHIAPTHGKRLQKIVREIEKQKPDLILLGGDFVKGHRFEMSMSIEKISKELAKLKAPLGIYAVLGNHDWMQKGEYIAAVLSESGIKVLANENVKLSWLEKDFWLAGVEDYKMRQPDIAKALIGVSGPAVLLSHSPDVFPDVPVEVDLTLVGHNHGGQVALPWFGALLVPSDYGKRYERGLIVEEKRKMLVSKGLGTSVLPLRFNCRPEIVEIEFE